MVQNAFVKRIISDDVVEVSLLRQTECGLHCNGSGSCESCGQKPTEDILATASNDIGAKLGDVVEVEPYTGHNLTASFIVFVLPCLGLALGYLIGQSVFHMGEGMALLAAAAGLVISFIPAFLLNRSMSKHKAPEFRILKQVF